MNDIGDIFAWIMVIAFVPSMVCMAMAVKENKPKWLYRIVLWGFIISTLIWISSFVILLKLYGDRKVTTYRTWETAVLPVTGILGEHYLARCYDKGGVLTGSYFLIAGSVRGELSGQNCRTFALLEIESVGMLAGVTHPNNPASIPVEELPASLPAHGIVIVPISEGVTLLPPYSGVTGYLYAGRGDFGLEWVRFRPINIEVKK